ncbi:hypothetical protein G5I_10859 [Acromyrmex echinatior]|uniref:Uncharacterized protein n=1 Tax=Acromyrmex echinatior TaxID=103372 RepID=F4WY03_ACREC|nr:hypothetical protein G5I_10859 [Acromyrmex echinatior]
MLAQSKVQKEDDYAARLKEVEDDDKDRNSDLTATSREKRSRECVLCKTVSVGAVRGLLDFFSKLLDSGPVNGYLLDLVTVCTVRADTGRHIDLTFRRAANCGNELTVSFSGTRGRM